MAKADKTKLLIKEVAKKHFIRNGFKETFLAEIATEVGVDRRTIYRHYENKEVLLLHIVLDVYKEFSDSLKVIEFDSEFALMRINELFNHYYEYMVSNEEFLVITSMLDRNLSSETRDTEYYAEFIKSASVPDDILIKLIELGQEEDTIKDLDANLLAVTMNNSLLSLASRIASHKEYLDIEQDQESWAMLEMQAMLLVNGIKR